MRKRTARAKIPVSDARPQESRREHAGASGDTRLSCIVADDHPSVSFAVSQLLVGAAGVDPDRIRVVTTSSDLLVACSESLHEPLLVVLDLVMPGRLKRVSLVRSLLSVHPSAKILVYTADESPFLARAVIDAGALGFVAKTSPAAELLGAIAAVRNGNLHIDHCIDLNRIVAHPWSSLTESERTVLVEFCRGRKAADIVASTNRSYSTIMTHKYNGLNKLGLRDGSELLSYIYIHGLLYELDQGPVET